METIKATMPGVFYRRPAPDADPFVEEGAEVAAGQTICLVEVMKTFNELKAEAAGTLTRFLVEDGEEIAMGQDLAEFTTHA
ncbi:acetyl-CoA carboxylase [Actinomadura sp. SCN-SB]|uniref:acetyl-CoA carboxylase n=1 Tax=Actinomadura sp. SCN-SB TaxID=3373092 RepID=UPI00375137FF